ncbi:putative gustatory receptor 28a isoform X2 [Linepithema humile]|uniref:putative gustatory receptor 28a isoform X2 n=2 Tax=Linepithema humile TaxID=83485 RepID=UPI0006236AE5|nr:PREDICTED: uncharacterized protein LOC105676064 isoform X2 [Linepithema humile]
MSLSIENLVFMDAKMPNFFESLNKINILAEKISKQKPIKIKSGPHENSFWTLRILIIFFKLIGLATFAHRIVVQRKKKSCTFQYSEIGIIYNAVLITLMISSNYLSIPYRVNMEYENKTNLTVGIEILQTILGTVVICTILLSFCIDQKSLVRIANRLMAIEHEIDYLYRLYPPLRRQRVLCTVVIIYILKGCLLIVLMVTDVIAFQSTPISWLTDILPTFHVGWLIMQYFLLVTIIQANLADVNRAIQSLSKVSTSDQRPQSLCQTRRIVVSNSTIHQLLQLRDAHCHLCEISQDVSDFYSLPILFGISFLFLTLIYNGYYLLSPLLMSDEVLEYEVFSNTVLWLIFLMYPISLFTNRITKILKEMEKTGNVVHNLLSCTIGKEAKSEICCSSSNFRFNCYIARYSSQLADTSCSITLSSIRWSVQ